MQARGKGIKGNSGSWLLIIVIQDWFLECFSVETVP
jgi:hypothetical protein